MIIIYNISHKVGKVLTYPPPKGLSLVNRNHENEYFQYRKRKT